MNSKRSNDTEFILVGQGLAGSILAMELLRRGRSITVFDTPGRNRSSTVAAGMFNPVTGRKFMETWRAGQIFPYLLDYYPKLEEELKSKFFYPLPVFRPFLSDQEREEMLSAFNSGGREYFDRIVESLPGTVPYYNEFGGLFLKKTGYVNIPVLLDAIRDFIRRRAYLFEEFFDHSKLRINSDKVSYGSFTATKIIFCEGYAAVDNPLFNWIPFRPVKGEIIRIESALVPGFIFNRQVFILPWTDGTCRVGATYDWNYKNVEPSAKAEKYLQEKLNRFLLVSYTISGHVAGIRPATLDRRPVLGIHPEIPSVAIFNGLGSKGISLAPYFAGMFVDNLLYTTELDKEVDIIRFK